MITGIGPGAAAAAAAAAAVTVTVARASVGVDPPGRSPRATGPGDRGDPSPGARWPLPAARRGGGGGQTPSLRLRAVARAGPGGPARLKLAAKGCIHSGWHWQAAARAGRGSDPANLRLAEST